MNGTSVSNGTRLSPISISQRSFGNLPESLGEWKTPLANIHTHPKEGYFNGNFQGGGARV